MTESAWRQRLRRIFRKEASAETQASPAAHPFRTAPLEREPQSATDAELAERELPESLRTLLEKKRGTSP